LAQVDSAIQQAQEDADAYSDGRRLATTPYRFGEGQYDPDLLHRDRLGLKAM